MSETEFVITRTGYNDMRRELNEILTVKRPQVIDRIRQARQVGDPAENCEYEEAKRLQAMLEARIKELKAIIAHASIVDPPKTNGAICVGSRVVVKDLEDDLQSEFTIVGPAESSPADGRISHESLVGAALLGRKAGEKVTVDAPGGLVQYEIVCVQ